MRKLATLTVAALLAVGTMGAAVGTAGASVPSTSKFCKAVKNFKNADLANPASRDEAQQTIKQLAKIQKAAKGNTKKAAAVVLASYKDYADGDSAREAFGNADFATASVRLGVAITKCFVDELPDITIPSLG